MKDTKFDYYNKIAPALSFLNKNYTLQPSLAQLAEEMNMSVFHLQRIFKEWLGISPKKISAFSQYSKCKRLTKE
ncbi:MAG: AraC family transcriptional regulator [Marinifilaceae bacterium]|jgi:AraC family transcriptional regulator of adaptative response/methylated-DNA-[protein]-cysteine methyltransferase|nr:AraC family transcriptional regulator [Marinifilaceae bacterium]